MSPSHGATRLRDPFACASYDAAICFAAIAISLRYSMALAQLGREVMWGAVPSGVFWFGLLGAPFAAIVPSWLLGRFTPANPAWPAIGLALPPVVWSLALLAEPIAMLFVGGAAVTVAALVLWPARHGRKLRNRSIDRRGLCPGCGYSLAGLNGLVCPECGGPREA